MEKNKISKEFAKMVLVDNILRGTIYADWSLHDICCHINQMLDEIDENKPSIKELGGKELLLSELLYQHQDDMDLRSLIYVYIYLYCG
jgi:hypothetical protein